MTWINSRKDLPKNGENYLNIDIVKMNGLKVALFGAKRNWLAQMLIMRILFLLTKGVPTFSGPTDWGNNWGLKIFGSNNVEWLTRGRLKIWE